MLSFRLHPLHPLCTDTSSAVLYHSSSLQVLPVEPAVSQLCSLSRRIVSLSLMNVSVSLIFWPECCLPSCSSGDGSSLSSGLAALAQPFKLRLARSEHEKQLRDYSSNVVLIEPLASMTAVEDFLWSKVYRSEASPPPPVRTASAAGAAVTVRTHACTCAPHPSHLQQSAIMLFWTQFRHNHLCACLLQKLLHMCLQSNSACMSALPSHACGCGDPLGFAEIHAMRGLSAVAHVSIEPLNGCRHSQQVGQLLQQPPMQLLSQHSPQLLRLLLMHTKAPSVIVIQQLAQQLPGPQAGVLAAMPLPRASLRKSRRAEPQPTNA